MIVKNEEARLPACLASSAGLVEEIVIVDTGSTDGTRALAAESGAKLCDSPWADDFSAARNEGLARATGAWIFWLDADDRLDEPNRQKLRDLFAGLGDENVAYMMKCLSLLDPASGVASVVDHARLFRNHPEIRWRYRVHEQIVPSITRLGGKVRWTDVVIHHTGYQEPGAQRAKRERNLRLVQLENAEHPDNPYTLFNLGLAYHELGRPAEALPYLRRSLELAPADLSILPKLYALLVQGHQWLNQRNEALAACRQGRTRFPADTELLFQEALLYRDLGDLNGAAARLLHLVQPTPGLRLFHSGVDPALRGYRARHELATILFQQGRLADAESQWRAAVAERPDYTMAWLGLGEVFVRQGRWADLDKAVQDLEAEPARAVEAAVLRARGHMARKEYGAGRAVLEEVIGRYPLSWWPRLLLGDLLIHEGQDWAAAEQALHALLAVNPEHEPTRHKLATVQERLRRES
jgi:tetratricopeptide (TPR) repeat protein